MNYGRAVRTVRAAKGLSQKELAEMVGKDASYLSLIESGRREPSSKVIESLAGALRIPPHLFTFLASDKNDLRGVSEEEARALSRMLLEILISAQDQLT
jgi:transcriptional regulator with XRE-family HTH domain